MNQHAKNRYQAGLRAQAPSAPPPPPPLPKLDAEPLAPGLHSFVVAPDQPKARFDRWLAEMAPGISRTRVKTLIEAGYVTIDGLRATDSGAKLRAGQAVSIDIPEPGAPEPAGEDIPLTIVFEDDYLIVLDKPAGLVVHPSAGHETGTLVNALIAHCGDSLSGIGGVKRPGIVHRLDRDTTGLLVVAKTDVAHQGLAALFADHGRTHNFSREYIAFIWGVPERRKGTIDAPLGRHGTNREKQTVLRGTRGREAITHYLVEDVFCLNAEGKPLASRVRCALETGRTHQIRVHLAHAGCPVMGDPLYATGFRTKASLLPAPAQGVMAGLRRQALHAAVLGFDHPVTGEPLRFESKLPEDLRALDKALRAG